MKPMAVAGPVLIAFGVEGLVYGRFSYMTQEKLLDVGPITATVGEQHHVDIPDIAGIGAIVGGLLVFFSRHAA
jgi:hypothetical protein